MQQARYSMGAIMLHWLLAIAVIVNWRIAASAEHAASPEAAAAIMAPHKALGMTILALTVLRLAWRFMHRPPPVPARIKAWEQTLAKVVHGLFYVLLLALPLGGWFANSSYGQGIDIFGLFTVPALPVAMNPDLGEQIFEAHAAGGTAMLILIALHILGALKHQFFDRNGALYRMLPWGTPKA